MKRFTLPLAFFFLLIGCVNIDTDKDVMPEAIEEIVELSQTSPEHLNLILEIKNIESDSLAVNIFLDNSDTTTADTLYHSSSFPSNVAYINRKELTHPFEKLVFFDDLITTVVEVDSKKLISSFQTKSFSSTPYEIISLFRYTKDPPDNNNKHFWLVSDPVEVK